MEWLKGIAALALVAGFIGVAFWKSRGVPPSVILQALTATPTTRRPIQIGDATSAR
jgi:hypothetical protein